MATNAISDVEAEEKNPARCQRKVVRKDQLLCQRSLFNWFVCLKILIRESLFFVKWENWDQIAPQNSPRGPGSGKQGLPGRWGPQDWPSTGGGGPAMVPNLHVCKHPFPGGWHTQGEEGRETRSAVVPSSRRG